MTEQQGMKVYELAKELGLDSISLLGKLDGLNIKVKSHMSELGPEEVGLVRGSLGKKSTPASIKKTSAAKVRKKTTDTSAKQTVSKQTAPKQEAEPLPEKKPTSTVIRRRLKADGVLETVSNIPQKTADEHPTEGELTPGTTYEHEESQPEVSLESDSTTDIAETVPQETVESPAQESVSQGTLEASAPVSETPSLATDASPSNAPSTSSETIAEQTQPTKPVSSPVKRAAPVFTPRPTAPRRSILKIVEPKAPDKPKIIEGPKAAPTTAKPAGSVKGTATQDKDGFRIIKMTKENLDQMVEEEAAKKRGGGKESDLRPEDVRFADYRKKEMVFLPKKKKLPVGREIKKTKITTPKAIKRIVEVSGAISVQDLASQLNVKATDVIRKLMGMGQMATINQTLDFDTATLIASEYQYEVKNISFNEQSLLATQVDKDEDLKSRPPVVTVMGHVDHGKTSLLDAIRETQVASGEAGGITQHIGASSVEKNGKLITFIDTPGHEAFTKMRARGANSTDIVVLVVAADDGVMPQTREAVSHAQAANVPIIVAVNKIDKPGNNPEKVKQELSELNLLTEDWGGQTQFVPVSALKKTNIDKLLESILLQAEVMDLKANPNTRATGTVLEARLEKGRGPMATLLVRRGTLKVGDPLISGSSIGKAKAMMDDKGRVVKEATPGTAVELLGFESLPSAGEPFSVTESEMDARKISENRVEVERAQNVTGTPTKVTLDDLFAKIQAGTVKELNVILKTDVYGSLEAIRDSLTKLATEKVKVKVLIAAPGAITESDVMLASASNAIIIGFNVRPETKARQLAEAEHIEIKCYGIIYELIEDIKKAMAGLLDKKKVEKFLGRAEVRQTFTIPKAGTIAGTSVIDGKIIRGANVRLLRDSRIIFDGKMSSLKRFKDDAKEVATGFECGIGIENYNDVKPGDIIEAYQIELVNAELTG